MSIPPPVPRASLLGQGKLVLNSDLGSGIESQGGHKDLLEMRMWVGGCEGENAPGWVFFWCPTQSCLHALSWLLLSNQCRPVRTPLRPAGFLCGPVRFSSIRGESPETLSQLSQCPAKHPLCVGALLIRTPLCRGPVGLSPCSHPGRVLAVPWSSCNPVQISSAPLKSAPPADVNWGQCAGAREGAAVGALGMGPINQILVSVWAKLRCSAETRGVIPCLV